MKKTEGNGMTVDQENRIIRQCDRHIQSARRQMKHQPYQADFRDHIMQRFERVE